MPLNQQSRWECSRRREGTTLRGSRSGCAPALKFRGQTFFRMYPQQSNPVSISLTPNPNQEPTNASQLVQKVYSKLHTLKDHQILKPNPELISHLSKKNFWNLILNVLSNYCEGRKQLILQKIKTFERNTPKMRQPPLTEGYYFLWKNLWQLKPSQLIAQALEGKLFARTSPKRNGLEIACWLVYINFSLLLQKNRTVARLQDYCEQNQAVDYVDMTPFQVAEDRFKEFMESSFIKKFFIELVKRPEVQHNLISALNVATVYCLVSQPSKKIAEEQENSYFKNPPQIDHEGMLFCLNSFLDIMKVYAEMEQSQQIRPSETREEFSEAVLTLAEELRDYFELNRGGQQ